MRIPKYKTLMATLLAAIAILPQGVSAQKIKILDISGGGTTGMIRAELADMPEGRAIKKIVTRRYQMSTGAEFPKEDSYQIFGNKYIMADLDFAEGDDYFYRLEVTLDDDTHLQTDMYNVGYTQGAVWADDIAKEFANSTNPDGDFTWFSNPRPWTGVNHTPITPADPNGRPLQIHRNYTYPHGMSLRATANGTQNATLNVQQRNEHNANFTSVRFTFGLQAFNVSGGNSTGNCRVIFSVNGAETGWKGNMKAVTNAGNPYYFDATQANNAINTIGLQANSGGVDNIAVLGALRLYYPVPANAKTAQSIVFETQGGKILPDDPDIELSAYATGNTPVYYAILQGADVAELDGNVLRPMRDKTGEVVVEAFTFGDDNFGPASSTQTWSFKFGPTVDYLDIRDEGGQKMMYVYADTDRKTLESLTVKIYGDHRVRSVARTIAFDSSTLPNYATHVKNVYALPLGNLDTATPIYSISYNFAGDPVVNGPVMEGREEVYYLKASDVNLSKGTYGNASFNEKNGYTLGKGAYQSAASLPVGSAMETKAAVIDLSLFSRFAADVSGHQNENNSIPGNLSFALFNGVSTAYLNTGSIGFSDTRSWDFPLRAAEKGKTVKVTCSGGFFGVGAVGSPRLYYKDATGKEAQEILMEPEHHISNFRPFDEPLRARTSAGLPLFYTIKSGEEYAAIVNDTILSVRKLPEVESQIVIEAYSPGDKYNLPAPAFVSTYYLNPSLIIRKGEVAELEPGAHIGDMVIFGDATSCGQAVVKEGVVHVDKMTLRYTFVPGEWTSIAFPADLDLSAVSDLGAKGFSYATEEGTAGTYLLRAYDAQARAADPEADPWAAPSLPHVEGLKGYMMKLESADAAPVEIAFTMRNMALDFHNHLQAMNLTVDLSQCEPESRHTVFVRPTNVKGNTLRVDMRYVPTADYSMHVNHTKALESMRVTFAQDRSSMRLTLPDQSPARVIFYDKKGKKVVKAVNYVSPMSINIADMKHGQYRMVVFYGPAAIERMIEL